MKRKGGQRILITVAIGGLLVAGNYFGYLNAAEGLVGRIVAPISRGFANVGSRVAGFAHFFGSIKDLSTRNHELEREVADLKARLSEDAELRVQNDALRRQLSFGQTAAQQLMPATIIAYQPDNFRAFITIARGSADGLKEGMPVVSEGALVGTITDVQATTAKVFLLVDPDFKVNALDQTNDSRATGTVHGQIGKGLLMDKVPQDQTVAPNDTIITSGLGGGIPKGLIIGTVQSVDRSDNEVFQTAQLVSPVKFNRLELVFVVTSL